MVLDWHLGDVVRKLRGLETQTAFGQRTGTSRPTISRLELTGTGYNADTLARIAQALGCSVSELHAAVPPALTVESRALLDETSRSLLRHWRLTHGASPRQALTAQQVQAQLLAWRRDGAAASTCNHRRRALVALYRALDGPGADNPAAAVRKLPEPRREPRGLPWPIVRRILVALPDRGRGDAGKARPEVGLTRARLWVLATTGWPHAVLARLAPRDLHLQAAEPHAVVRPRRKGRGARARVVPLAPAAVRALRHWVAVGAVGPFSQSSMRATFLRAVARARARWEAAEARLARYQRRRPRPWPAPDDIRVYDLRHSFGMRAILASGGNLVGTREVMLHESVATTMQYLEAAMPAAARAVVAAMAHGRDRSRRRAR